MGAPITLAETVINRNNIMKNYRMQEETIIETKDMKGANKNIVMSTRILKRDKDDGGVPH